MCQAVKNVPGSGFYWKVGIRAFLIYRFTDNFRYCAGVIPYFFIKDLVK